jgi:hypothetical protein
VTILVLNKLQDLLSFIGLMFTIQVLVVGTSGRTYLSGDFDVSHKCNSWYIATSEF